MSKVPAPRTPTATVRNGWTARWGRLALIVALALCCLVAAAPDSQAQYADGLPGFFQHLFGFGLRPAQPVTPNATLRERVRKPIHKRPDFVSSTATRAPGTPGGAPVKPTFFVSVIGDSLAILAAQGVTDAFADRPEVSVTDLARDISGLARDDYYDWPKAARDLLATKPKIDVAVIMLGINDVQPFKDNGEMLDTLNDKWRAAYAQRIDALLAPFRDAHIQVFWVGLPPMRDEPLHAQALALNEIYRDRVGKAGGTYVDIWDAFTDPNGQYADFGPDAEGQNAKLRNGAGGIYFTKAGSRKVAQILEPDIRRELDKDKPQGDLAALPPDIEKEASAINAEIQREKGADGRQLGVANPAPVPKPPAGPIVSLTALPASPGGDLVKAADAALLRDAARQAYASPAGTPAGRADNFAWPPPSPPGSEAAR
jgi:hypothetical protein